MNNRLFLIIAVIMLSACGFLNTQPSISTPSPILTSTVTPYPTHTPYPTYTPYPTFTPFIPSVPTQISIDSQHGIFEIFFPGNYALSKRDETYRGGSPDAYDFVQVGDFIKADDPYFTSQPPYFYEIQFHTLESLQAFYQWCAQQELQGSPCFLNEDPKLINLYNEQLEAFRNQNDYEDYEIERFGSRLFFKKTKGCGGGYCAFREYTTFILDVKIVITILMHPNNHELQTELSDKLFQSFGIEFHQQQ